ncbi:MAG: OmpA family protein [Candidatus Tectimicrobiota bacterium]
MHNRHLPARFLLGLVLLLPVACHPTKELVILLPGPEGQHGALAVGTGGQSTLLDTPLAGTKITAQGQLTPHRFTPEHVQQLFAQALAAQPPPSVTYTLYFLMNSTDLAPESKVTLEKLFADVTARQAVEVQITGHTDRVGSLTSNDRLSLERAQAVREMLVRGGLQTEFMRAVGRGEREPLVDTPDEQPEPRNRRVEITVR